MDDNEDASAAIDGIVENLRLAGVEEDAIASALLSKGALLLLMAGVSASDILEDMTEAFEGLAVHLSKKP
jgi:hypothetical protein